MMTSYRLRVLAVTAVSCTAAVVGPVSVAVAHPATPTGHRLVAHADWSHPSEGWRIHVTPTHYGRKHAVDRPDHTLSQALHRAGPTPLTITPTVRRSLQNQLRCHAQFASFKPHWNLEAWRPAVSYTDTVAALCNP